MMEMKTNLPINILFSCHDQQQLYKQSLMFIILELNLRTAALWYHLPLVIVPTWVHTKLLLRDIISFSSEPPEIIR